MQIDYSIEYSNRKSLSIIVERDSSVIVKAPFGTNAEAIDKEVSKRKHLLFGKINHPQKYQKPKPRKEFVSGESLLFLGHSYKLEVVSEELKDVVFDNRFTISKLSQHRAEEILRNWYLQQAKEVIVPRVSRFANNLGVRFNQIRVLDLKYRWGSCTPKNNIHFNWRLVKAPVYVIDYIIVHELAHLLESNHTQKFWDIVSVQLPHYDKAKQWLKENGHCVEVEF